MTDPITKREIAAFTAMALTTRGPYWKLSGAFARVRAHLAEFGLQPSGVPLGLFYDDPALVPPTDTRYSICYPIDDSAVGAARRALGSARAQSPAEAAAEAPPSGDLVSLMYFPATVAAVVEYEGPAADSPRVYERLRTWIEGTADLPQGPPRELYIAEPGTLGGGLMHVEVQQPLAADSRLPGDHDPEDEVGETSTAAQ
ncbi:MAG: GyrI-like domain-containing protein [Thermoleophilia bacterium]